MKKSFFITLLFSPILLIADDLIVDKNSINQYEQNNYAHFNPSIFMVSTKGIMRIFHQSLVTFQIE